MLTEKQQLCTLEIITKIINISRNAVYYLKKVK